LLRSDNPTPRDSTVSQEAQIFDEKGEEEQVSKQPTGYFSGMFGGASSSKADGGSKKSKK